MCYILHSRYKHRNDWYLNMIKVPYYEELRSKRCYPSIGPFVLNDQSIKTYYREMIWTSGIAFKILLRFQTHGKRENYRRDIKSDKTRMNSLRMAGKCTLIAKSPGVKLQWKQQMPQI